MNLSWFHLSNKPLAPCPQAAGRKRGRGLSREAGVLGAEPPCQQPCDPLAPPHTGISSPVKKTEMDKSPFNSPSPQDSPRLSSFTQHHRPVIAVHSGEHCGPPVGRCHWALLSAPSRPGKSHRLSEHESCRCSALLGKEAWRCRGRERPGLTVILGLSFPFCMGKRHNLRCAP